MKNGGCQMHCRNTVGSFSCGCSPGYVLSEDKYSCVDIDDCITNNGGCSDNCNNFPGSGGFFCSCNEGYQLDVEGKTCLGILCPAVAVPPHSTLRCFQKGDYSNRIILKPNDDEFDGPNGYPISTVCRVKCGKGYNLTPAADTMECMKDGQWSSSTPQCVVSHCPPLEIPENGDVYPPVCTEGPILVKKQCYFTCRSGYHIVGKRNMLKCKNDLSWSLDPPICEQDDVTPFLICPDDITMDLMQNESTVNIFIPQPITNVDDFEVLPDWITVNEWNTFPSGKTDILFRAKRSILNSTVQCTMTVTIIDNEPPVFVECPASFEIGGADPRGVLVTWNEPVAVDNVGIQSMTKNLAPNSTLTVGIHYVEYTAKDGMGNTAQCAFQINITSASCGNLADPKNGKANCKDWLSGKLCRPACEPGYERDSQEPQLFACRETGTWTPKNYISPCLSKCLNGTIWSSESETCEDVGI